MLHPTTGCTLKHVTRIRFIAFLHGKILVCSGFAWPTQKWLTEPLQTHRSWQQKHRQQRSSCGLSNTKTLTFAALLRWKFHTERVLISNKIFEKYIRLSPRFDKLDPKEMRKISVVYAAELAEWARKNIHSNFTAFWDSQQRKETTRGGVARRLMKKKKPLFFRELSDDAWDVFVKNVIQNLHIILTC